jgi:hypothetical protein
MMADFDTSISAEVKKIASPWEWYIEGTEENFRQLTGT